MPDNWTANHKTASGFFPYFVMQQASFLLGNGINFAEKGVKEKLGVDFDTRLYQIGKSALIYGVSYGFFNFDKVIQFEPLELVPLYDEVNGALMAAIRFWQVDSNKPLRVSLYEIDGVTEYLRGKDDSELKVIEDKKPYRYEVIHSEADGTRIYAGEPYPAFPIIPFYGNYEKQSSLVGLRESIDCYDLIKSGFANDLDDASMIYWTLENAGGMDDISLAKFIEHMKTVRAAVVDGDDGAKATAHTMEVPYQSREAYLTRLENDLFRDAMALKVKDISASNTTATQIMAAYEPLTNKTDEFEYCAIEYVSKTLALLGVDAVPSFKRSQITNQQEVTDMVLSASVHIDDETLLSKLPWLTPEEVQTVLDRKRDEEAKRISYQPIDIENGPGNAISQEQAKEAES